MSSEFASGSLAYNSTQKSSTRFGLSAFLTVNYRLWGVVFPAIISQLTLNLIETISMLFVGSLNNTYATAGVGLGIIYVNCTT